MSPNELGLTMRMEEIGAFKLDRINRIYGIAKSIARGFLIQPPRGRKIPGNAGAAPKGPGRVRSLPGGA